MRLLEWMHTVPELERIIQMDRRGVRAGAYRLSARYLLDGGRYSAALRNYLLASASNPEYALQTSSILPSNANVPFFNNSPLLQRDCTADKL